MNMYITDDIAFAFGDRKYIDLQAAAGAPGATVEAITAFAEFAAIWLPKAAVYRKLQQADNRAVIAQIRLENDIKRCEDELRNLKVRLLKADDLVDTTSQAVYEFCMAEAADRAAAEEKAAGVDPWAVARDPWSPGPSYKEAMAAIDLRVGPNTYPDSVRDS